MIYKWDPPQAKLGPITNLAYVCEGQVRRHTNGHYYQYKKVPALAAFTASYEWVRYDLIFMKNVLIREMVARNDPTFDVVFEDLGPALSDSEVACIHVDLHKKYLVPS
jgi:hypothetical protein